MWEGRCVCVCVSRRLRFVLFQVSGPQFLGLSDSRVSRVIEALPGYDEARALQMQSRGA